MMFDCKQLEEVLAGEDRFVALQHQASLGNLALVSAKLRLALYSLAPEP